jgi:tetratricopeptide (TPR) repeat protein
MAVAHEQRYWQRSAVAEQVSYTSAAQLREWVATANLYGASSVSQARAVIRLLLGLGERDRDSSHRVTAWLHGLYPGRSGDYWGFLEPDVIAEQVVGPALTRNPALLSTVLPDSTVTLMQARHAVEVASRACDGSPAVAGTIWAAVAARPALAPDAVKAATRAQGRAARALRGAMTQSLQRAEAPLEVLRAIVDGAPDLIHSLPVRDIESLRPVLGNFRRLTAFSRRYLPHLARVLHRLARALGQQGRFEDALAVLTEEVSAWQSLVDDGADQAGSGSAFEALAAALYEQASTLLSLCRFSEALPPMTEAAAIFQRLSDARPGAFRPELAAAILGRGIVLDDLDRPADAVGPVQVAIARYRALADHDPDKYQPCLADGLLRLSKLYRSLQQPRDALDASTEAVTLYHRLAGAEPARYRPLLAKVLNHRAADLGDLGAHALAQACLTDAISIYRELTDDRSPRYLSEIATAYYGLAVQSRHLGQGTQALYWLDQAIASYRRLARPEPDSQAILATALAHRGIELSALGQHQSAVDSVSEAVAIYQRLVNVDPGDATLRARLRATYLQLSELWRALGVPERAQRYQLEADLLAGSP